MKENIQIRRERSNLNRKVHSFILFFLSDKNFPLRESDHQNY